MAVSTVHMNGAVNHAKNHFADRIMHCSTPSAQILVVAGKIPVLISQKPWANNGTIRHICNLFISVAGGGALTSTSGKAARKSPLVISV